MNLGVERGNLPKVADASVPPSFKGVRVKTVRVAEVVNGGVNRYLEKFKFENDAEGQKFIDTFNKAYVPQGASLAQSGRYLMAMNDESRGLR